MFWSVSGMFSIKKPCRVGRFGSEGIVHLPPFLFNPLTAVQKEATSFEVSPAGKARKKMSIRNIKGGSDSFHPAENLKQPLLPHLSAEVYSNTLAIAMCISFFLRK